MSEVATVVCRRCDVAVPAGNYCGLCGCVPENEPGRNPIWLRPRIFGAAPGESVLRPSLASSLFPQLPSRSRTPFRITLVVALLGLLVAALLRLPALGIAISTLGLPLLFAMYLRASEADRDVPRISLVLAGVLGAVLGAAWVLGSGQAVSRTYGVPMAIGLALHHLFKEGFLIPTIGMLLMIVPIVVVRLVRPGSRESLDGFVIGAFAALCFCAVATLIRLIPQTRAGLIAHARPMVSLVVEVVLCGITVPITAAAAGGMVGVALWFRDPARRGGGHHGRVRSVIVLLTLAALVGHAGVGVVDIAGGMPQEIMLVVHLTMTLLVLLALRLVLQLALLHEQHDPIAEDSPLLCPHCEMVVPDMAFCPACGAATRASSRISRQERRAVRPQATDAAAPQTDSPPEDVYPGYALPAGEYRAPGLPRTRFSWLLSRWGVGITAASVALGAVALVLAPKVEHYMCPPDCGKPPRGTPVMALPRFEPPNRSFSVSYPAPGSAYTVSTTDVGVTATYTGGDGGVLQLFSEPARGRSAQEVTGALLKRAYPDAKVAYEIPNAMVGYQLGYGVVADDWPQNPSTSYSRVRILIMTAVKNDVALVAFATGPYHAFGPDFGPGPPSGANLEIAQDMGKYVNSFRWKDDPAR